MFLNSWQDWGDRDNDAKDQVEGDEELVKLALADVVACVVGVAQSHCHDGQDVEKKGGEEQSPEPVLVWAGPRDEEKIGFTVVLFLERSVNRFL